jgi:hypothetical protein
MSERTAPQITEEWLAEQAEISRNRRRKIVEFFDSAFMPPETQELRAQYDPELLDPKVPEDSINHIELTQKKEN